MLLRNVALLEEASPDSLVLALGDVNHCKKLIDELLPNFSQYVNFNTRQDKLLDVCYGYIKNAYTFRFAWTQ